jgi:hypothetical protein
MQASVSVCVGYVADPVWLLGSSPIAVAGGVVSGLTVCAVGAVVMRFTHVCSGLV